MRVEFYVIAQLISIITFSLSLSSYLIPEWINFHTPASSPIKLSTSYGLAKVCSSSWKDEGESTCRPWPSTNECSSDPVIVDAAEARGRIGNQEGRQWGLCQSWITARFASQLSLAFSATSVIAIFIVILGQRVKRENGWRMVVALLSLSAVSQIVTMSFIAHEFNSNDLFFYGCRLGQSFIMSTVAWSLDVLIIVMLSLVGIIGLMREDTYERIGD